MAEVKIEEMRDRLNKALETKSPTHKDIIKLSQELDLLILEHLSFDETACRNLKFGCNEVSD